MTVQSPEFSVPSKRQKNFLRSILLLTFVVVFTVVLLSGCGEARAEINLELSGGHSFGKTDNGNFWAEGYFTNNRLRGGSWSVGLSGHLLNSKHVGLLWDAEYSHLGTMTGSNNIVCSPDGCASGVVPIANLYRMNVKQQTRGGTFGLAAEVKAWGLSVMPEAGVYVGRTTLTSQLKTLSDEYLCPITVKNTVVTHYYGVKLSHETPYGNAFIRMRYYPKVGGNESFIHHITTYEAGISFPVWK